MKTHKGDYITQALRCLVHLSNLNRLTILIQEESDKARFDHFLAI